MCINLFFSYVNYDLRENLIIFINIEDTTIMNSRRTPFTVQITVFNIYGNYHGHFVTI